MTGPGAGRRLCAAALVSVVAGAASGGTLSVEADGPILQVEVPDGDGWCLSWNHSVTGGAVADCFVNDGGRMLLDRSYLHDFAAGLGDVPGRGTIRAAEGGGYWIEKMAEPIEGNALVLRVGRPSTDHHLRVGGTDYSLSAMAAGQRVILRLTP